jgi:hypothetical protein
MANLKKNIALALMVLLSAALLMAGPLLRLKDPADSGRADFMGFYLAGRIVNQGNRSELYNEAYQLSLRERLFGPRAGVDVYLHPPFEALFFAPLARLPYPAAYFIWDLINLLMFAGCLYLLKGNALHLDADSRLIFTLALAVPLISTLGEGQDSILLLLLYISAFINLKKGQDFWAGSALGASLFRFQLAIPFLLVFLALRRWRVVLGASVVGLFLGAVSLFLIGWRGMQAYAQLLIARTGGSYSAAAQMPTVRGFVDTIVDGKAHQHLAMILVILSSLALLDWLLRKWGGRSWDPAASSFDLLFSLSLVVAFLLSFHSLVHTLVVLALPILLLLDHWAGGPTGGLGRWVTVAPLILLFVTAALISWVTVNNFTYLFPAVLLFAFAISREISSRDRALVAPASSPVSAEV